jgi:hypothetical protein
MWALSLMMIGLGIFPPSGQIAAQERVQVTVDYVSVEGVYLALGSAQGVAVGDTIQVFSSVDAPTPLGALVLISVTRRRSVATPLDTGLGLARGDVLFVRVTTALGTAPAVADSTASAPVLDAGPESIPPATLPAARPRAPIAQRSAGQPRVSGRISLDVNARETRTSWTGDLSGETRRRFATPTTRLSLVVAELPGGVTLRTNLRASYRYTELGIGPPPTSIRAYEVAVVKTFDSTPLEFRLGRFYNPYEAYSAYWDGALIRVGRSRGLGAGVAAGFEPSRYNEGFSSELPKVTGFADFAARGRNWRYDTDVSFHLLRPTDLADQTFAGWTQRLSLGRVTLSQRLRMDRDVTAETWSIRQLRVRAGITVAGPFRLLGTYGRTRPGSFRPSAFVTGPQREDLSFGVGLMGRSGSMTIDAGRTRWEGADDGLSFSGNASLRLGSAVALLSGRHWKRADMKSIGLSPGLSFEVGPLRARTGYRLYRTEGFSGRLSSHAADLQVSGAVAHVFQVTLGGQQQWGTNLVGTRIRLSVWRSF